MLRRLTPKDRAAGTRGGAPAEPGPWRARAAVVGAALVCLAAGTALGLALTAGAVRRGFDVGDVRIGAWSVVPSSGTPEIDPYRRVRYAATGEIPMAAGQGVAFTAIRDDAGRKLDRACSYTVSGPIPQARFWTLGALDPAGQPLANAADRFAFASTEVLRDGDGRVSVALSPEVRPGNWLPLSGTGRFSLVLRLYDTAVTALSARDLRALAVPTIVAEGCP